MNVKSLVIGFQGEAGHGKNTAADLLAEHLKREIPNLTIHQTPLARSLKWDIACLFGQADFEDIGAAPEIDDEDAQEPLAWVEENKPALRSLLQSYGETKRQFDQEHWIKDCAHTVDYQLEEIKLNIAEMGSSNAVIFGDENEYHIFMVTDVRYPNETAHILDVMKGPIYKIVSNRQSPLKGEQANHISESFVKELRCSKLVYNHGTIEEFSETMKDEVQFIKKQLGIEPAVEVLD